MREVELEVQSAVTKEVSLAQAGIPVMASNLQHPPLTIQPPLSILPFPTPPYSSPTSPSFLANPLISLSISGPKYPFFPRT